MCYWYSKRGAMFGLDARIALAIFGGLSIITGAALYSAIAKTKATAIVTEIQEIHKAISQYMMDTGTNLPPGVAANTASAQELVTSSKPGWNGPYLMMDDDAVDDYLITRTSAGVVHGIFFIRDVPYNDNVPGMDFPCSASSTDCNYYVSYGPVHLDLLTEVDELVDNGDGLLTGTVRATISGSNGYINFKGPVRLR